MHTSVHVSFMLYLLQIGHNKNYGNIHFSCILLKGHNAKVVNNTTWGFYLMFLTCLSITEHFFKISNHILLFDTRNVFCISHNFTVRLTDMQGLERHLEHVRRQHAESRDPVVQQLQSMVAAFEGREEAYKPLCAQLQQVSETMRSSAQQIQASNSRLETSVQEAMKRSV